MNYSSQQGASHGQQPGQPQHQPQAHGQHQPQAPGQHGHAALAPAPYPQHVPGTDIEIDNKRLRKYDRVKAGEQTVTIRSADDETKGDPLAYVHVPQDAPKGGHTARPPFTVSGMNGELLCSVRSVGAGAYGVYGGDGAAVGRITRRGGRVLPWPRRAHWTVQAADGREPLTAKRGTVTGWVVFSVTSPIYCALWAIGAVQGLILLLLGDKDEAKKESVWDLEPPSRALWRTSGEPDVVIDYRGGGIFRLASPRLDHRLAYAQAVLHVWDGV